ncbi:MAG: dihydroneopterin aldolase [Proteobacteria bacterium]|nr:dihydroneopterin aldolase [Pseudomonadota bacterium]
MSHTPKVQPLRIADAETSIRHVFIRDLVLTGFIGVYRHEHTRQQRIRINLDLAVREDIPPTNDSLEEVVSYEDVADGIRALVASGHVNLVETLADRIAEMCLEDQRVRTARVRIEKLDVFADAESAGVEIERFSTIG